MILYFSATGNDKYVAERIAAATRDRLTSIAACVREGRPAPALTEGEALGLVTPTYFWGLPSVVEDFLRTLPPAPGGERYVWHVLTFGTMTGDAGGAAARLLRSRGFALKARFSVRMVDTWTPLFDLSDPEKNRRDTEAAEPQIDAVIEKIRAGAVGDFDRRKGLVLGAPVARALYRSMRRTARFRVTDGCIGCGLCVRQCPCSALELREGRPVWVKDACALCLGCLHRCPKFAIRYGSHTAGHGQFVNPNTQL